MSEKTYKEFNDYLDAIGADEMNKQSYETIWLEGRKEPQERINIALEYIDTKCDTWNGCGLDNHNVLTSILKGEE